MSEKLTEPFIHFHIPKTAGTSTRAAFIESFGPSNVAYRLPDGNLVLASNLPFKTVELDEARRIARSNGQLEEFSQEVNAVNRRHISDTFLVSEIAKRAVLMATGHFTHNDITEEIAGIPRVTILRNPLHRIWSHYHHWVEARGSMWWHTGSLLFREDIRFEDFALDPELNNFQTNILGSLSYEVVGDSDNLNRFFERLGIAADIPILNPGSYLDNPTIDTGFLREFTLANTVDYEAFESAEH